MRTYTMSYTIYAYDRYNFDKKNPDGTTKKFLGIPDSANGRFVVIGKAKFFTSVGTMSGSKFWSV